MAQKKVSKLLSKKEISAQMDELIGKLVARDKTLESLEKSADGFRELISSTKKNIRHPDIFDIHRFKLKQLVTECERGLKEVESDIKRFSDEAEAWKLEWCELDTLLDDFK